MGGISISIRRRGKRVVGPRVKPKAMLIYPSKAKRGQVAAWGAWYVPITYSLRGLLVSPEVGLGEEVEGGGRAGMKMMVLIRIWVDVVGGVGSPPVTLSEGTGAAASETLSADNGWMKDVDEHAARRGEHTTHEELCPPQPLLFVGCAARIGFSVGGAEPRRLRLRGVPRGDPDVPHCGFLAYGRPGSVGRGIGEAADVPRVVLGEGFVGKEVGVVAFCDVKDGED